VSAAPTGCVEAVEHDLIDRIAEALPVEVRAEYYRELRHCRSLPDNDEMLRILRVMQFLTLLIHEAPARMTAERAELDRSLNSCGAALNAIERRLEALPQGVASSIGPERVVAGINESLRQRFVETTIPQTGEALAVAAAEIKRSVAQFVVAAREIAGKQRSVATEASDAVRSIESAIDAATRKSREATSDLTRALLYVNWTSLVAGGAGLFLLGLIVGGLYFR
jgi:hypothetical protein